MPCITATELLERLEAHPGQHAQEWWYQANGRPIDTERRPSGFDPEIWEEFGYTACITGHAILMLEEKGLLDTVLAELAEVQRVRSLESQILQKALGVEPKLWDMVKLDLLYGSDQESLDTLKLLAGNRQMSGEE